MGLDMYLRAKHYVSGYEWEGNTDRELYNGLRDLFGVGQFIDPHTPSAEVSFTVAYWRKANAIHKWFVDNVQDGIDECQSSYVSREKLLSLRAACQRVIDSIKVDDGSVHVATIWDQSGRREEYRHGQVIVNAEAAAEVLPTTSGFFFGGTAYDEGYIADLHDTVAQIDRALGLGESWSFEYQASW